MVIHDSYNGNNTMLSEQDYNPPKAHKALGMSTLAFTVCFAVWTIFSIIGVKIKQELGLSETEFGLLVATPVLTGSISRIFLGIWTERFGGRLVFTILMLTTSVAVYLLSSVETYAMFLVAALGIGLAGGSFIVGIAYTSEWYDKKHQGTALGIFGAGNVGAAVTNFGAPFLVVALGWQQTAVVYSAVLAGMAVVFWFLTENDPRLTKRASEGGETMPLKEQLAPLAKLQVWRFSLYYFFVFGAFVALASWLPRYYVGAYDMSLGQAGMLAALYALPASIFRALGGWMSDRFGARAVMYWTYGVSLLCLFILSYPETQYVVSGIKGPIAFSFGVPVALFVFMTVALGFFMSLGKAAVYKHIPVYYPGHVGSVGGLVGMIGGLGGFVLPITFGALNDLTGVWTSCFMFLFLIVLVSFIWMHVSIIRMERRRYPELTEEETSRYLPEIQLDYGQERGDQTGNKQT
ncbi:NNP family nitrate/nitrite transporter-like MFS transporter [Marinobacter persicus]|jgi:NNP family nitrate/nitrite transporter-like MFS transporter|uniref:NNP family nitrate/nitrite transporter-like MFS transporter n=2 Tax=Marinobacter persicus TaxID=930118 RepID=A0A2S6G616_9GAMM|nr:NNP family nitrate/nitrite transporter-like MFS transporter [Marinobacter persicus]PPK54438.1 NNP family nitrate/nitrite transporter-like MFS transporter [Marinobacter persicus]PPK57603.1 NNP family nitrate/nitrite transporter-like MFS transporter [Marinobacter persicus]